MRYRCLEAQSTEDLIEVGTKKTKLVDSGTSIELVAGGRIGCHLLSAETKSSSIFGTESST